MSSVASGPSNASGVPSVLAAPGLLRLAYLLTGSLDAASDLVERSMAPPTRRLALRRVAPPTSTRAAMARLAAREPAGPVPDGHHAPAPEDPDGLWEALALLPPATRVVLVLRHGVRQAGEEIAAALGMSVDQVVLAETRGLASLGVCADLTSRTPQDTAASLTTVLAQRATDLDRRDLDRRDPGRSVHPAGPAAAPALAARWKGPRGYAVGAVTILLTVVAVGWAVRPQPTAAPSTSATRTTGTATPALDGDPATDFSQLAGSWVPIRYRAEMVAPRSIHSAFLAFTRYGHWNAEDGCGATLFGYFSLAPEGEVAATVATTNVEPTPAGCSMIPVQAPMVASLRLRLVGNDGLVALEPGGGEVLAFVRQRAADPGTAVEDLRTVSGVWKHTGLSGELNSLSDALPLRDLLTIDRATPRVARWGDSTGGCRVVGGELTLDARGYVSFVGTSASNSSCAGTSGRLPSQLALTIGLVLEDPETLLLVDDRGREVSRLVRVAR